MYWPRRNAAPPNKVMAANQYVFQEGRALTLQLQPPSSAYLRSSMARIARTYEFIPPPLESPDKVLDIMRDMIQQMNTSAYCGIQFCNYNVKVEQATKRPPLWPCQNWDHDREDPQLDLESDQSRTLSLKTISDTYSGKDKPLAPYQVTYSIGVDDIPTVQINGIKRKLDVKPYTFSRDETEPKVPTTLRVTIRPPHGRITADKIHVQLNSKWIKFEHWLLIFTSVYLLDNRSTTKAIEKWYERNGKKPFMIMALPPEIRLLILLEALCPQKKIYPEVESGGQLLTPEQCKDLDVTLGSGHEVSWLSWRMHPILSAEGFESVEAPNLALLDVNEQIKEETLHAALEGSQRCFHHLNDFLNVSNSKTGVAMRFNVLGNVQLCLSTRHWLELFGVHSYFSGPTSIRYNVGFGGKYYRGDYLSRLPSTTRIEIGIDDPGLETSVCNDLFRGKGCHSVLVNFIMALIWEEVKELKRVKVVGYVRKTLKDRWNAIFSQRPDNLSHKADNDFILLEMFGARATDIATTCICRTHCSLYLPSRYPRFPDFDFEDESDD